MKLRASVVSLMMMNACHAAVTPFTLAHISDMHISAEGARDANLKAAISEINALNLKPLYIINTGDMVEMGAEAEFTRYLADVASSTVPIKHTPGNHETRWADMSINRFVQHFGSPNISFLANGVRFIGFNAAIWLEHHGVVSGDTRAWIVSQLAQDPAGTPAVLFCHQPPMYVDNLFLTGDIELWDAIAPYNVRLFLCGHGHIFKHWVVNGIACHEAVGVMEPTSGYCLYDFTATNIKVYDKVTGGAKTLIATVPLTQPKVTVSVKADAPSAGSLNFHATVSSAGPTVSKVQYQVDHHEHPADANWTTVTASGGQFAAHIPTAGLTSGRHTMAFRAVDSSGGEWIRTVPMVWNTSTPSARSYDADTSVQSGVNVDNDSIYFGCWDGSVRAVARNTMSLRWSFPTGGAVISRPEVDATTVYAGSTDTKVYAINKASGTQKWAFPTGGPVQAHPLLADGAVFVGSGDHNLYAIDAATGAERWRFTMGLHCQARPAYMDGVIFVGAWDNGFYALDARTGALKWKVIIGSIINYAPAVTSPCAVNGRIMVTAAPDPGAPNVRCLDAKDGSLLWSQRLSAGASPYGSPTSDGVHVYLATLEGTLHCLNLSDGTVVWESPLKETVYDGMPVLYGGQVICNTLYGGVEGLNAANGRLLWSCKTGGGLQFAWPCVDGGVVYQASMDGTVTAITPPAGLM